MRAIPDLSPLEIARFWSKVHLTTSQAACWTWQGRRSAKGYGEFALGGVSLRAPRIAWKLFFGDPGDERILHACDNPPCCNPFHLRLGSDQANTVDAVVKRRRRGLSPEERRQIRARLRAGERISTIARSFGVTHGAIAYHASRLHLPDLDPYARSITNDNDHPRHVRAGRGAEVCRHP